jgi:hypothetical protein
MRLRMCSEWVSGRGEAPYLSCGRRILIELLILLQRTNSRHELVTALHPCKRIVGTDYRMEQTTPAPHRGRSIGGGRDESAPTGRLQGWRAFEAVPLTRCTFRGVIEEKQKYLGEKACNQHL